MDEKRSVQKPFAGRDAKVCEMCLIHGFRSFVLHHRSSLERGGKVHDTSTFGLGPRRCRHGYELIDIRKSNPEHILGRLESK